MPQIDLKELTQNVNKIVAHWTATNAALPNKPLVIPASKAVPSGMTLAQLTALGSTITADFTAVTDADNATQAAQDQRNRARQDFLPTAKLFRKAVLAYLPESTYVAQLPTLPSAGANDKLIEDTGDDLVGIWAGINANTALTIPLPFVLSDGTDLTAFQSILARVKTTNTALPGAKETGRQVRANRDGKVKDAIAALRAYRKVALVHLPPGHPLLATIPNLT